MTEEVIQADRDAAADYLDACGWDWGACGDIREGRVEHPVVKALARHRLAHLPTDLSEERAREVEALRAEVAALRTQRNEVVEECARIASATHSFDDDLQRSAGCATVGQRIATAIRNLKSQDEPR